MESYKETLIKLSIFTVLLIVGISACSQWQGDVAKVVISFGSAGRSCYYTTDKTILDGLNLKHEIVFSNKKETLPPFTHEGVGDFISYIAPGNWTVWVYSRLENGDIFAAGTTIDDVVNLQAGQDNIIQITMHQAHLVKFNSNGGSDVPEQKVFHNKQAVKPSPPGDINFGGWYRDKDLVNPFSFEDTITESITLYARWLYIWWEWDASKKDNDYDSATKVIVSNPDKSGCDVTVKPVTGNIVNDEAHNWASQVGYDYTATAGKTYKATWTWNTTDNNPFRNVTIRYAQDNYNDTSIFYDDSKYQINTDKDKLTIPVTEETKTYYFTIPESPIYINFTFMVGGDTGSFYIRDFKIEEVTNSSVCTVTFNNNEGSGTVQPITVNTGGSITLPSGNWLSREDFTFDGWSTNKNGTEETRYDAGKAYNFTGNVILYAVWKEQEQENTGNSIRLDYWWSSKDDSSTTTVSRDNVDGSVCGNVTVGGEPNPTNVNWKSQVGCQWINWIEEKTYKVTWIWKANNKPFTNVTIQYVMEPDDRNSEKYFLGTGLIIPVTEETKTYYFIMPSDCDMNFSFKVGADTGTFCIRDFKIEEVSPAIEFIKSTNDNTISSPDGLKTSATSYQIVDLPTENKYDIMKVSPWNNSEYWAAAIYSLDSYLNKEITITLSVWVKRAGAAGNLGWHINDDNYPLVASRNNAKEGEWYLMNGTWTGIPSAETGPKLYLTTYENDRDKTTYYIDNFEVSITETK